MFTLVTLGLLVSAASVEVGTTAEAKVTPVQKVIQLLTGMLEKGKKDKNDEGQQYAAYKQFCDDTTVEKQRAIAEANEMIGMLEADIAQYVADMAKLTKEIAVHDEDISVWNGDVKAATKVREMEKTEYDTTWTDYSESIDALGRAIAVLKEQAYDRKAAGGAPASFGQVSALTDLELIPNEAKGALVAFLQNVASEEPGSEGEYAAAPEAAGYEFQSHGIIDMLKKLEEKFKDELRELEKSELESKHQFKVLIQQLTSQIDYATEKRKQKAESKATKAEKKAQAESDIEDLTAARDKDTKLLADLTAKCAQKASDFESRQKLRTEEIAALNEAIEIIQSAAVSGAADKHLPSLAQRSQGAVLAQLRTEGKLVQLHVSEYLKGKARQLNSRVLSAIALRVAADPFAKVKQMIKDLLARLMQEAGEEAEHKGWCDKELSTNEQTRKEKTKSVETLFSEIDLLDATIAKRTEDLAELAAGIVALDEGMADATEMRQEEKAKNTVTISDAKEASAAVAQALTILKEFYAKAGEATALLQTKEPEIFDSPYKGMVESGGVIGMLEVIASDFARLEAETKAAEDAAQEAYDQFMADSKADKAAKKKEIERFELKKQDEEQARELKKEDLAGTQKELEAALDYFDKLKPSCINVGVSYEDRVKRRQDEIDSLQEALKILNGEAI